MDTGLIQKFLESRNTLCVLEGNKKIFTSKEGILFPLLEYIDQFSHHHRKVTIWDKTLGNAAALLAIKAGAARAYSPLGSQLAAATLTRYHCEYHFTRTVPYILARNGKDMCPMEKLSISEGMDPDKFYEAVKRLYRKAT